MWRPETFPASALDASGEPFASLSAIPTGAWVDGLAPNSNVGDARVFARHTFSAETLTKRDATQASCCKVVLNGLHQSAFVGPRLLSTRSPVVPESSETHRVVPHSRTGPAALQLKTARVVDCRFCRAIPHAEFETGFRFQPLSAAGRPHQISFDIEGRTFWQSHQFQHAREVGVVPNREDRLHLTGLCDPSERDLARIDSIGALG